MRSYLELAKEVIANGIESEDRTGTGTRSLFGMRIVHDMKDGFPLLTTKKIHFKSVVHELLWMIGGGTNIAPLKAAGVTIWDEWADKFGELGPVYGKQWRAWPDHELSAAHGGCVIECDQLASAIDAIRNNPTSRRIIVSAWNVGQLHKMALPPCHLLYQFYCRNDKLSIQVYQRSCDVGLGLPFNLASYALLLIMVGMVTDKKPDKLIWVGGDVHVYNDHIEALTQQIVRKPYGLPWVMVKKHDNIDDYVPADIKLTDYDPHPAIPMRISI